MGLPAGPAPLRSVPMRIAPAHRSSPSSIGVITAESSESEWRTFLQGQALYVRSAKRTARTNEVRAVLRRVAPHKGLHPLHRLRIYPRELCSGNNLLSAGSYRRKVGKIPYRQPGRLLRSRRPFSYPIHPFYLSGGMHHIRNGSREAKSREDLCPARRERPAHGGRQRTQL